MSFGGGTSFGGFGQNNNQTSAFGGGGGFGASNNTGGELRLSFIARWMDRTESTDISAARVNGIRLRQLLEMSHQTDL